LKEENILYFKTWAPCYFIFTWRLLHLLVKSVDFFVALYDNSDS